MMAYSETIFPRERYTYLSGTRQISIFQDYWRNDKPSGSTRSAAIISSISIADALPDVGGFWSGPDASEYEAMRSLLLILMSSLQTLQPRLVRIRFDESLSFNYEEPFGSGGPGSVYAYGTGSMWPLDSHVFSDRVLLTYLQRPYSGSTS